MSRIHTPRQQAIRDDLKTRGFSLLQRSDIQLPHDLEPALDGLAALYEASPSDGPCRSRFYGRYVLGPHATVETLDLRTNSSSYLSADFQQGSDINPEQYGAMRSYAPLPAGTWANSLLSELVFFDLQLLPLEDFWRNARRNPLLVGIHLLRMIARPGRPGVPSPSVPHQDGEPFTFVHLMRRQRISGGESQVFRNVPIDGVSTAGELLLQTTLTTCLDTLVVWDKGVFHHVTPIHVDDENAMGTRDVLLIDFSPFEECKFGATGRLSVNMDSFDTQLNLTR